MRRRSHLIGVSFSQRRKRETPSLAGTSRAEVVSKVGRSPLFIGIDLADQKWFLNLTNVARAIEPALTARTFVTTGSRDSALNRPQSSDRRTLKHDRLCGRRIGCDRREHRQHGTHSDHGQQARTHCRRGRFGAGEDLESAAHGVLHSVLKSIASLRWSELYSWANTLRRGTRRIAGEARELQIRGATGRDARRHCLG
jgi:hypothetical protein